MPEIIISIDRLLDDSGFPEIVECSLYDIWNKKHTFHEKLPVVGCLNQISKASYPHVGFIRCELIGKWQNRTGKTILTVSTKRPDYVESVEGIMKFDLFDVQVQEFTG